MTPSRTSAPARARRPLTLAALGAFALTGTLVAPAAAAPADVPRGARLAPLYEAPQVSDPDSYIVMLDAADTGTAPGRGRLARETAATAARLRAAGVRVTGVMPALGALTVSANAQQLAEVRADESVAFVQEDGVATAARAATGPLPALLAGPAAAATVQSPVPSWGLDRVDQPTLPLDATFSTEIDGSGVTVYLMDSGLRADHTQFTGRVAGGMSAVDDAHGTNDCYGHGTHVAGTALGSTHGVARGAQVVNVRVLDCGLFGTWSDLLEGMDWITQDARLPAVTNFSINAPRSATLDEATRRLVDRGITFVASAGNAAEDACTDSPAWMPEVITVGATTRDDARNAGSNYGSCVDVWAPGKDITSATNTSPTAAATHTGTSMAAPHVTGAVALYLQAHPTATPAQVKTALTAAATPGVLRDVRTGSPNLLVNIDGLQSGPGVDEPVAEPAPTPTPEPAGHVVFYAHDWSGRTARSVWTGALDPDDELLAGDWDGDGTDSVGVRRGNLILLWNGDPVGAPAHSFWFGAASDQLLVGDWDGDGRDGVAVRRGTEYHLRNSLTTGDAERTERLGTATDEVHAGAFGAAGDTLVLRAPGTNAFRVHTSWDPRESPRTVWYGMPGEPAVVGDWDGDGITGLGIHRANIWHLRNALTTGNADVTAWYGLATDSALVGDWNADGRDDPAVVRAH